MGREERQRLLQLPRLPCVRTCQTAYRLWLCCFTVWAPRSASPSDPFLFSSVQLCFWLPDFCRRPGGHYCHFQCASRGPGAQHAGFWREYPQRRSLHCPDQVSVLSSRPPLKVLVSERQLFPGSCTNSCLSSGRPGHTLLRLPFGQALTHPSGAVKARAEQRQARPLGPFHSGFKCSFLSRSQGCLLTGAVPGPAFPASDSVVLG